MLAVFAVSMWVLGLIARPLTPVRIWLLVAMVAGLVLLFAIPLGRRVFALQLPPTGVLFAEAAVVLASVIALTIWRARSGPRSSGAPGQGEPAPSVTPPAAASVTPPVTPSVRPLVTPAAAPSVTPAAAPPVTPPITPPRGVA
jgi:hypothetical protein